MTKGRSTTPVTVRVQDELLAKFKEKAAKKGLPYTVLIRHLMYKELGLSPK
ncbi:hypothetical protein [Dehalogenimonas etheniformans]|uniref:hypothetical protein n=1 Tax=Dehalogenimonas etheniformans TaxID=1536648 RepID=UPI001392429A|nr:hypothetical protein [Dehalogenimonas etheniformans]QNT75929.1 hypothetical protein HX448_04115 [Dehalogenimonas etheniformans]